MRSAKLPFPLKNKMEMLSRVDLGSVRVFYDSPLPDVIQANAFTMGCDIYLAPGQESCLSHEAWHVVQQLQNRVPVCKQVGGIPLNDSSELEQEADFMADLVTKAVGSEFTREAFYFPETFAKCSELVMQPVVQRKIKIGQDTFDEKDITLPYAAMLQGKSQTILGNWEKLWKSAHIQDRLKDPEVVAEYKDWTAFYKAEDKLSKSIKIPKISPSKNSPSTITQTFPQKPTNNPLLIVKGTTAGQAQVEKLEASGILPMGSLPWTHNTGVKGLLGILSDKRFKSFVEESVNFRYDLDSRYHEGVSFIMRPQLEWCFPNTYVQDLYRQSEFLRKQPFKMDKYKFDWKIPVKQENVPAATEHKNKRFTVVREHLQFLDAICDFRNLQLQKYGVLNKSEKWVLKSGAYKNYNLSMANPQLRIPNLEFISTNHVSFIIITQNVLDAINNAKKYINRKKDLDTLAKTDPLTAKRIAAVLANTKGVTEFNDWVKKGKIIVCKTEGFSHISDRLTGTKIDERPMAAKLGLEFDLSVFPNGEKINNSPSALDMQTFVKFQRLYFEALLKDKEHHRAYPIAERILKSKPSLPGSDSHQDEDEKIRDVKINDFIALLSDVHQEENESDPEGVDNTHHASEFIGAGKKSSKQESDAMIEGIEWFELPMNIGGGDCLLHALSGRDLDFNEVVALRESLATAAGNLGIDSINSANVYQSLAQSAMMDEELHAAFQGRHELPIEVFQAAIRIPGLYSGDEEIRAYSRHTRTTVYVVTYLGELRSINAMGTTTLMQLNKDNEEEFKERIQELLDSNELLLFKFENHWEKILRFRQ